MDLLLVVYITVHVISNTITFPLLYTNIHIVIVYVGKGFTYGTGGQVSHPPMKK
jgi:hypothetical protein